MTRTFSLAALGAALGVLTFAGTALAQMSPAPPPAPGVDARPDGPPPPPGARPRHDHGHGHMHPPAPPPRGARFHIGRGETRVDVRCAENEPMRACVDAAVVLLDKLGVQAR